MSICDKCLHEHVCPERSKNAVKICAAYKEQNTDTAMCVYHFDVVCNYPAEDCRNCPVRLGEGVNGETD